MASQNKVSDGSFITQFLEGTLKPPDSVPIVNSGKAPEDLPEYDIGEYKTGTDSVTAAYTGPGEGLTSIRRVRVHLFADSEIDFIDTINEHEIQNERGVSKKVTNTLSNNFGTDSNANKRLHQRNDNSKTQYNIKYGDNESLYSAKKRELQLLHKSNDQIIDNTEIRGTPDDTPIDPIANVKNWNLPNDNAYGISVSLYEKNLLSGENVGNPVADCFGILVRNNCCIMALADGVNWGNGARLAAQCAVQGSIDYLNSAIFGIHLISSTKDIFVSLVRSFWEAHSYIIEAGGALTTLSVVVVLPLLENKEKHVVCCCNVGDSLGYVYSKKYGIREITQVSLTTRAITSQLPVVCIGEKKTTKRGQRWRASHKIRRSNGSKSCLKNY
ncbi:PP2C-like domain-containing protein CG9801 isoform X2 [Malaya genurostris]|nr:PP2C-like domain-containing protein CG9801 isoform X2 [Malaya genurostris]